MDGHEGAVSMTTKRRTKLPEGVRAACRCGGAALSLTEQGFAVLPLVPGEKRPLGQLVRHGVRDASSDPDVVVRGRRLPWMRAHEGGG